jgi:L-ascorbate metabolism protein UlaG (beta-lactamase superfamily)
MIVTYHGENYIKLSAGDTTLSINPISKESGKKTTKFGADICLMSCNLDTMNGVDFANNSGKNAFLLHSPGEYEVKGITIKGIQTKFGEKINTIFTFTFDNIKVCILGAINEKLESDIKDQIGDVDMLFVPVCEDKEKTFLNPKDAVYVANSLNAKVVIPVGYDEKSLPTFLKESGSVGLQPVEKLTIKKKEVDSKDGEVVYLMEI